MNPMDPTPEIITATIHDCNSQHIMSREPTNPPSQLKVLALLDGRPIPILHPVELVRIHNADQAYALVDHLAAPIANSRGLSWGDMRLGVLLPRRDGDLDLAPVYVCPPEETAQLVWIKKLNKKVIEQHLAEGGHENPFKEIFRQQTIGNDEHVLRGYDALQDEDNLYIITPYCGQGDLYDRGLELSILISDPVLRALDKERQARDIFRQMLEDIKYLHQEKGICHRDIDPGNFLVKNNGQVFLNDLAMSFLIPASGKVINREKFGNQAYLPPEIEQDSADYGAKECDLWACVVTLFNLLTGERLYYRAHPTDLLFVYLIMRGGLSLRVVDDQAAREVARRAGVAFFRVSHVAQAIRKLSPEVRELFENSFKMDRSTRWKTEQVLNCAWMRMDGGQDR